MGGASVIQRGQKSRRRVMAEGASAHVRSDTVAVTEKAPWMGLGNPLDRETDQPIYDQPDSQLHNRPPQAVQPLVFCGGRKRWPQWPGFRLYILAVADRSPILCASSTPRQRELDCSTPQRHPKWTGQLGPGHISVCQGQGNADGSLIRSVRFLCAMVH